MADEQGRYTPMQRAVVVQALYKELGRLASTKEGPRADLDADLRAAYDRDGTTQRTVMWDGVPVAKHTVRMSKPVHEVEPVVEDPDRLVAWLRTEDGADVLRELVYVQRDDVMRAVKSVGVLPDGCRMVVHDEPAHPVSYPLNVDVQALVRVGERELEGCTREALGLPEGGDAE